jgi:hypothetical protein
MVPSIVQADLVKEGLGALDRVAAAGDLHRHLDVFNCGQRRHEVEELEHEPDLLAAQPGKRIFIELGDVDPADRNRSARRGIESGNEPQQRGLAAARRPDDRKAAAVCDIEIEGMKNRQRLPAAEDSLADTTKLNH